MEDNNFEMMRFDLPKEHSSIIKVIGVGGGGSNAVNYMYEQGIKGVDFIVCNTDGQALDASPVPTKVQLGSTLTAGRGAGSKPEVGRNAAVENLEDVKKILGTHTTMVFVTAGMGGGTGTGAAPVIARAAKEMGILTVGIVTVPFVFEGKRRSQQAEDGLEEMRQSVDTLLIIRNDKLRELFGNLSLKQAFGHADEVLCTAAKGIAEVITLTGEINVDMNDVNTVMRDSGRAIMGSGRASGDGRALNSVRQALESPLLNDNDITGANFVLLNITYGEEEVLMDEITEITDYIQECAGSTAEVIWGYGQDDSLGTDLCVTVIATGFSKGQLDLGLGSPAMTRIVLPLDDAPVREITQKVDKPTQSTLPPAPMTLPSEEPFIREVAAEIPVVHTAAELTPPIDFEDTSDWEVYTKEDKIEDAPIIRHTLLFDEEETPKQAPIQPTVERLRFAAEDVPANELSQPAETAPVFRNLEGDIVNRDDVHTTEPTDRLRMHESETPIADRVNQPSREEMIARNKEREQRIRDISLKLKTPSGLSALEDEPAYLRRKIQLEDTPHSADSTISRFTLFEEEGSDGKPRAQLREDNSFLHKNVD
jgi:cell division protein FtsZ